MLHEGLANQKLLCEGHSVESKLNTCSAKTRHVHRTILRLGCDEKPQPGTKITPGNHQSLRLLDDAFLMFTSTLHGSHVHVRFLGARSPT